MTYEEFVDCYREMRCIPRIYPFKAISVMMSRKVARRVRAAFMFWSAVWAALIGLFIWQIVEINLFNAVVLFIFIVFLPGGMVRYTANYIITKSLEDAAFFAFVRDLKVMHPEDKKQ